MNLEVGRQFGKNLARQRELADLTQEEVAWRASLHRTEVSQLERGLRLPRLDTIAKLAGAVEAKPEEFFEGIVWTPGEMIHGRFKPDDTATL